MSDPEDGNTRHVCSIFESQTWRKSLCKNCFHSLQEHSEQLLAQEGQALAKEKAAAKASGKASTESPCIKSDLTKNKIASSVEGKSAKTADAVKDARAAKEKSPKEIKDKSGVAKDTTKDDGKLLTKDVGRENGKALKPVTNPILKNLKGKLPASLPTTPTSLTSSLTTASSKSSLKSTTPSPPTTSPSVTTNSPTSTTSDKTPTSDSQKPSLSKTKNFASKFESKTPTLSKDKPFKTPDIRPGNSSNLANNIKPADDSSDPKPSNKPQLEKTADKPKSLPNKIEPKPPRTISDESPLTNGTSKTFKTVSSKTCESKPTKDDKSRIENQIENKSSTISTRNENPDFKISPSRSKPATVIKDTLNGAKEVVKMTKPSSEPDDKAQSSKIKEDKITKGSESLKTGGAKSPITPAGVKDRAGLNLKSSFGKVNENKGKQSEEEPSIKTTIKSKSPDLNQDIQINNIKMAAYVTRSARSSENLEAANVTKPGFLPKSPGKISDSKPTENTTDNTKALKARTKKESSPLSDSSKPDYDKIANSKDREKQKSEGGSIDKKIDPATSSSFSAAAGKQAASISPPSKSTSPTSLSADSNPSLLTTLSKSAESKNQKNLMKLDIGKDSKSAPSSLEKFKSLEKKSDKIGDKQTLQSPVKSPLVFPTQTLKTKVDQKDKTKEENKGTTKFESKDKTKEENKGTTKLESKDKTKEEPKGTTKLESKDKTKEEPKGIVKLESKDKTKEEPKGITKLESKDKTKEEPKSIAKLESKDKTKDECKVITKEESKITSKFDSKEKTKVDSSDKPKDEFKCKSKVDFQDKTKFDSKDKTKVESKTKVETKEITKVESNDKPRDDLKFKSKVEPHDKTKFESKDKQKNDDLKKTSITDVSDTVKLQAELKGKEEKLSALSEQLSRMEQQMKALEEERDHLKGASLQTQRKDTEQMLNDLRTHLSTMESQCCRLERDNQSLIDKFHVQEASVKLDQECRGKNSDNVDLEEDLEVAEKELEDVKKVNKELQVQIMEMKHEMDEMYDHFRESEHEEFRELQKELDITAKNCRILQFKLRKAERLNDQIEEDRIHYEEKLRMLQDQFDSKDAKNHIRVLEEELRIAKEVSVRLHDELDIVEDKRNKALDDNRHLTDLLEHTDRRQFRLQVEIDKLRDIVADLKYQLKEARSGNNNNNNNNKASSPDRKVHCNIYTRSID